MRRPLRELTCAAALALAACAEEDAPAAPRQDAGRGWDAAPVEDPCAPGLLRELSADARREGEAWVLTHDNATRAAQGALLAPCATAEHVTVWRHVMTREARLEVAVESPDPLETVAWVLDRCEPVLATPLVCAASAPVAGGARRAAGRTVAIQRPGAVVYVAVGGARQPPREGEGPRAAEGSFTLRVAERTPLVEGAACAAAAGSVAECAEGASCQRPEPLTESFACVRDGARRGRCRPTGASCDEGLRCVNGFCRGGDPGGAPCVLADLYACAEGTHCVDVGGETRCVEDGAPYGQCRAEGAPCDSQLRCTGAPSVDSSQCLPVAADGTSCDGKKVDLLCAEGSSCVNDPTVASVPPLHCQRDGSLGGACRAREPACDEGLACPGVPGSGAAALCAPARQVGEACGYARGREACVPPARCLLEGSGGVCRAPPYHPPEVVAARALDACSGGVVLALPSGAEHPATALALPFDVPFFGANFDRVWPSLKGYAAFGGRAPRDGFFGGIPLRGEGPMFAPLLADLRAVAGSRLCALVDGSARRLVLSWHGFSLGLRVGARVDVSVAVDAAGVIEFQYDEVTVGTDPLRSDAPAPTAAGIQSDGAALYLTAPVPAAGHGLRFTPR